MQIFLGLGTNLGDKELNLIRAKDLLMKEGILFIGQSEVLETEPLGGLDQPIFFNQVLECQTDLGPEELLGACENVEKAMGRTEKNEDWESRIIDVDILFYGDSVVETLGLIIPHAGVADRDFVLEGMCELAPKFLHPVLKKTMEELLNALPRST